MSLTPKTTNQKPQDEAAALREYGLAIASRVRDACHQRARRAGGAPLINTLDLVSIVASVELPEQEILDAPTCEGWWWARESRTGDWDVYPVLRFESTGQLLLNDGCPIRPFEFNAWAGPLAPPSTPSPADAQREGKS